MQPAASPPSDLFRFVIDGVGGVTLHINLLAVIVLVALTAVLVLGWHFFVRRLMPSFEVDQAELGLGDQKITLRPNNLDRTVAFKIWVELSTRKIGLPIDPEHDVISEIYDSWYAFFGVTRELIKEVPVRRVRSDSTQKIINLSIEVLNTALRPHLTRWQARFRRWYDRQLAQDPNADAHPQDIQRKFPDYEELVRDMLVVNERLIAYRARMRALVDG
jgi:hypothetical protein